jgi:multidrug efflux pump subunit AcrB
MGIPVALLGTLFLLPFFGAYLDSITLASMIMVIGIIVDDAIIIAENIQRHREKGEPPLEAAVEGIREVFTPVLTTILTTFLAFAPMFFMTGMLGKFVFVIPLVITLALAVSLIEAALALPAHLVMGVGHHKKGEGKVPWGEWFKYLRRPFRRAMRHLLRLRYAFVFVSFCLLLGTLWYAFNTSEFVLFPSNTADQFYLLIELPRGRSLEATSDKVKELEEIVMSLYGEELDSFATRIGTKQEFAAGENENWAIISVNLTPYAERERNADQIVESLRAQSDQLEGYEEIVYYIEAGGPPVGRPVTLRIVGANDEKRKALADSVVAFMRTIEGIKDIDRDDKLGKDQVELKIDYEELSRLGLTVADVAQSVRIAYDGEVVTSVRYGDEDVDFRVLLKEEAREDPEYLRGLLVPNNRGRLIPLKEAVSLVSGPGPSNYYHYDGERAVTVTADITKGVTTPLLATSEIVNHFDLANDWRGMRFVVGGEAEETAESMQSLVRAFLIAVVGIFFLLLLLFNSFTQPFLVMVAIPFGIMGVIIAFKLHDEPFGFVSMMGVVGLSGVVVNDSLVMVNHINRLRRRSPDKNLLDIVADGAADRLRAVILTTLTTVVGLLPLAYGFGGTDAYMAPMALALAYGLVFATPLTLGLIPCLYVIRADIGKVIRKIRSIFSRSS